MKTANIVALALIIVGGLNWGLVGLFDFNLVNALFGSVPMVEKLVYIVVGAAAVYSIMLFRPVAACSALTTPTADPIR